jgi:eukaryotic-like serine/threonine-protein kinase
MKPAQDISLQLDKYELLEVLGHGGMATVYLARDRRLGRAVAVKVIHRHLRDDNEIGTRFVREARAVAKLHHPNIVEVFDVSEPDERERYLVVELVEGSSLRKFLAEHRTIPAEVAAALTIEVADGIQHAHQCGVIHRDIKPENVLIKGPVEKLGEPLQSRPPHDAGRVKITDFGIAKVLDTQGVTATGQVLGSPSHMAPEQIEGSEVTARADVFGLGVLAYECMTGRLPFEGQNPAQVLRKVIEGRFIPVERMLPTVGGQLGRVVDRALAHDPADRFESAADFAAALQRELERLGFETPYAELTQYLDRPARYSLEFPDRIVERLVAAADKARNDGDVILSSSLFNRALAYKPHDSDLIAAVARIAKQRAISRRWRKTGFSFAVVACAGLLGFGTLKIYESVALRRHLPPQRPSHAAPKPSVTSNSIVSAVDSSERVMPQSPDVPVRPKSVLPTRALSRRSEPGSAVDTRPVQIVITGASGSRLLIDGTERSWFGVRHELSLGPHRFDVQPPNETCCVPPQPKVVEVVRGPAEQKVMLAIEFREATLFAQGPSGATLICGELFPGSLPIPGKRTVRVTKAETRANCTLLPPTGSTERPKTVDVVLRPGDTFTVSG